MLAWLLQWGTIGRENGNKTFQHQAASHPFYIECQATACLEMLGTSYLRLNGN